MLCWDFEWTNINCEILCCLYYFVWIAAYCNVRDKKKAKQACNSEKFTNDVLIPPPRKKKKSNGSQSCQGTLLCNMASDGQNKETGNEVQNLIIELHPQAATVDAYSYYW